MTVSQHDLCCGLDRYGAWRQRPLLVGGWVPERLGASFPFGTFIINVTESLLIW